MKYDFNVKKMKGKVQIDVNEWEFPSSSIVETHKLSGRSYVTYISKVRALDKNIKTLKKGKFVLLSKIACDIATAPTSPYELDGKKFYNIPYSQVMGVFRDNIVSMEILSLSSLEMLNSCLLFQKISKEQNSLLKIPDTSATIGKVIKTSKKSNFKADDIIIVKDNVSTPVRFNGIDYFATEERSIVGLLRHNEWSLDKAKILNQYILMKPYISENVLNSTILETPSINYEDLDYSNIYNRDLFKVYYIDETLKNISKNDILLLNRDYTNYLFYDNEKYFVIDSEKWISGKIIERDSICKN